LWKLPYFEDLELPNNIDVMHTEKNKARPFEAQLWTPRRQRITLRLESINKNYAIGQIWIRSLPDSKDQVD
jgi:hypothetical protein